MRARLRAVLAAGLALAENASAQPRRAPAAGCTAAHHTLAVADAEGIDATEAPALAFVGEGAVVVWRARAGALRLAAFDAAWRPLGAPRELSREAGAFAVAGGPSSASVAYVERGRELTLARVNARGEAQNVPRLLFRAEGPLREVALTRTDVGSLVVWRDDLGQASALAVDVRAAPRGAVVAVGNARSLRLAWLPSLGVAALVHEGQSSGDDPSLVNLSASGEVIARLRWPAATAGPFELPAGLSAAQVTLGGLPTLLRVPPGGATLAAPESGVRERFTIVAAAPDGAGAAVVFHDASTGRMLAARAPESGVTAAPAVVRTGPLVPASVAAQGDGAAVVTHRESGAHGGARVVATRVTCRR
jgi:hypothetical protein